MPAHLGRFDAQVKGGGEGEGEGEDAVEAFQAEMWSGRVLSGDLIHVYEHPCQARGHAAVPVITDDIAAIRRSSTN